MRNIFDGLFPMVFGTYDDLRDKCDDIFGKDYVDSYLESAQKWMNVANSSMKKAYGDMDNFIKENVNHFIVKVPYVKNENSRYNTYYNENEDGETTFKVVATSVVDGVKSKNVVEATLPKNCIIEKVKAQYDDAKHMLYFSFPREIEVKKKVEKTYNEVKDTIKDNIDGVSDAVIERIAEKVYQKMKAEEKKK